MVWLGTLQPSAENLKRVYQKAPTLGHIRRANRLLRWIRRNQKRLGVYFKPLRTPLRVITLSDSAFKAQDYQGLVMRGCVILLAETKEADAAKEAIEWKPGRGPRASGEQSHTAPYCGGRPQAARQDRVDKVITITTSSLNLNQGIFGLLWEEWDFHEANGKQSFVIIARPFNFSAAPGIVCPSCEPLFCLMGRLMCRE